MASVHGPLSPVVPSHSALRPRSPRYLPCFHLLGPWRWPLLSFLDVAGGALWPRGLLIVHGSRTSEELSVQPRRSNTLNSGVACTRFPCRRRLTPFVGAGLRTGDAWPALVTRPSSSAPPLRRTRSSPGGLGSRCVSSFSSGLRSRTAAGRRSALLIMVPLFLAIPPVPGVMRHPRPCTTFSLVAPFRGVFGMVCLHPAGSPPLYRRATKASSTGWLDPLQRLRQLYVKAWPRSASSSRGTCGSTGTLVHLRMRAPLPPTSSKLFSMRPKPGPWLVPRG